MPTGALLKAKPVEALRRGVVASRRQRGNWLRRGVGALVGTAMLAGLVLWWGGEPRGGGSGASSACGPDLPQPAATGGPAASSATSTPVVAVPLVAPGPRATAAPSTRVHAFYYPWYRSEPVDGLWIQWGINGRTPPLDLPADFSPLLGPYSSADGGVLARHMAWAREAGIGVLVVSWSGVDHPTNNTIAGVLDAAAREGLFVAWHLEPYPGRSARTVADDVAAITEEFGQHPAFFRASRPTRHGPTEAPRGVFYVFRSCEIPAAEWRAVLARLHADPSLAPIVLGQTTDACFIDGCGDLSKESHFDGLYSYDGLGYDGSTFATIARGLAERDSIFSVSVAPGYSAARAGDARFKARYQPGPECAGYTYDCLWHAAVESRAEWVSITSFNEWHEGTQIEPASEEADPSRYATYGGWPELYLDKTARHVQRLMGQSPVPHPTPP